MLLLFKANVNKVSLSGHSALYLGVLKFFQILFLIYILKIIFKASMNGQTRKVDYLLLNGANVNVTDSFMHTPLHHGNIRFVF